MHVIRTLVRRLSGAMDGDIKVTEVVFVRNRVDTGDTESRKIFELANT